MKTHEQFADDLLLYALGELTGNDRQEIEEHLSTCGSCRRELQEMRSDLGLLALASTGPKPPARVKERLMKAVAAEPRGVSAVAPQEPRRSAWWTWAPTLAAAALLLLTLGLWSRNDALKQDQQQLKDAMAELTNKNQDLSQKYQQAEESLGLLEDPNAVHVSLNPSMASKHPRGTAIFDPAKKRMLFMASNMIPPPPGMAYELWIIPMQGEPIPAGVFKPDEHGNAVMMDHPMPSGVETKAFAVTMEKEEGAYKPTMPILMIGQGE